MKEKLFKREGGWGWGGTDPVEFQSIAVESVDVIVGERKPLYFTAG